MVGSLPYLKQGKEVRYEYVENEIRCRTFSRVLQPANTNTDGPTDIPFRNGGDDMMLFRPAMSISQHLNTEAHSNIAICLTFLIRQQ